MKKLTEEQVANREIAATGRALRQEAERLREAGHSNEKIAEKLGTNENLVERMIGPEEQL